MFERIKEIKIRYIFYRYNEELLSAGPEEVQKCMEVLDSYGFQDEKLGRVICSCPALLFAHKSNRLAQNAENLFSHFTKNEVCFYSLYMYIYQYHIMSIMPPIASVENFFIINRKELSRSFGGKGTV